MPSRRPKAAVAAPASTCVDPGPFVYAACWAAPAAARSTCRVSGCSSQEILTLLPRLTQARAPLTREVSVVNEFGDTDTVSIPAERALTVYVDKRELVTLMTLGAHPELLVLGFLRNQRLVRSAWTRSSPSRSIGTWVPPPSRPARASRTSRSAPPSGW